MISQMSSHGSVWCLFWNEPWEGVYLEAVFDSRAAAQQYLDGRCAKSPYPASRWHIEEWMVNVALPNA